MKIILNEVSPEQYYELGKDRHVPLYQSPGWAKVKCNWENQLFSIQDEETGEILGLTLLMWVHEKNLNGLLGYLPHGPVLFLDENDPRFDVVAVETVKRLEEYGQTKNFKRLRLDPAWLDSEHIRNLMHKIGDNFPHVEYNLFPNKIKGQIVCDTISHFEGLTYEEWFNTLGSRLRSKIRKGLREGVVTHVSTDPALIDPLYELLEETYERHNEHNLRPKAYIRRIVESMPEYFFTIAELDGELLSMSLNVVYSGTTYYLYAGNRLSHPNLNIPSIMVAEVYREAIARGSTQLTLGGMRNWEEPLTKFKKLFVKEEGLIERIGVLDIEY